MFATTVTESQDPPLSSSSPGSTTPGRWRQKRSLSLAVTSPEQRMPSTVTTCRKLMAPSLSASSTDHSRWLSTGHALAADQGLTAADRHCHDSRPSLNTIVVSSLSSILISVTTDYPHQ